MVLHSNPLRGDESTPSSISLGWNVIINRTATPDPVDIDDIISYGAQVRVDWRLEYFLWYGKAYG
ncbi:hypothetical protein VCV18_003806 [Metarhizium anisopliae]